jgi:dsDNA-binding SOS-regulon protein
VLQEVFTFTALIASDGPLRTLDCLLHQPLRTLDCLLHQVLQSSEVERLRRELREMRNAFNTGRRKLNDTEEKLLESSIESAAVIDSQLRQQKQQNEALLAELAEVDLRAHSAFGEGVSAAAAGASEVCDRFSERVTELMREFQRKTLHINRADADLYMRMLQLQSWFLESLDRRIVQCREKMGSVYEFTLTARAAHQQALLVSDEKPGAQHGAGAPPLARGPALAPSYSQGSLGAGMGGVGNGRTPGTTPMRPGQRASRASIASSYVGLVDGGDSDDFDD